MLNVRKDFPFFADESQSRIAFLDSAASSQKHKRVIDTLSQYLKFEHANIHRGAYRLSAEATARFEDTRKKIASWLHAENEESIVFTRGTTEAINLLSYSLQTYVNADDVILLTLLEHHSNIVPWQLLAERTGVKIAFAGITADGNLDYEDFESKLVSLKPKIVSFTALSNALGTVVDVERLAQKAKDVGSLVCVDGAQSILHREIKLADSPIDFFAFSAHKVYGPTGVGVLYVKPECYQYMQPFMGGGDMIETVSVSGSVWAKPPQKFEAGTPAIAEVIALRPAIEFVEELGYQAIEAYEQQLFEYAFAELKNLSYIEMYGPKAHGVDAQASIIAFNVKGVHAHDVATVADSCNVQLRAGHHCAMPLLKEMKCQATVRMSLAVYNETADIDALCAALEKVNSIFRT